MSRAYKRRKKTREIGDLTYPGKGSRVSCNSYLSMLRKEKKKNPEIAHIKPDYGKFIETGKKIEEERDKLEV